MAVYVCNDLGVVNVSRSNAFELISITLALRSSHKIPLFGLYHPPKVRYQEHDLREYIFDIVDMFLQENPISVVICGGDFNHLNTKEPRGGGGVLGSTFAGYVPLASQNPYPIIVYSVTNYRPHLSHFWANG